MTDMKIYTVTIDGDSPFEIKATGIEVRPGAVLFYGEDGRVRSAVVTAKTIIVTENWPTSGS